MFTPIYFLGLVALFGGLFGSRFLVERANKFLSPEEKLMLMDSFSSIRTFGALPLVLVVFFFQTAASGCPRSQPRALGLDSASERIDKRVRRRPGPPR